MNNLIKLLLAVIILFFWHSCNDDIEFEINDTPLLFSKDTVYLDTVFTNIGSSTYNLKVYNRQLLTLCLNFELLKESESDANHLSSLPYNR